MMNNDQKKLVHAWLLTLAFVLIAVSAWQLNKWVGRGIFFVTGLYLFVNWSEIQRIESKVESVRDLLDSEPLAKRWVIVFLFLETVGCLGLILAGVDVGKFGYVFGLLALLLPFSYPLLLSQIRLFRRLGAES